LPDIYWDEDDIKGGYAIKSSHNYSTEINQLAIDLVDEHCLQQCVTEPVYSALQPFSCILVHVISQSVSRVSSPLHTVSFRTALITPPPSWPFLHVLSLRTISYRSGSSISDVGIHLYELP
jgi:hypothetical protein